MTERTRRAIATKNFSHGLYRVSISNRYGPPIHKPICIRSLRRANRQWLSAWWGKDGAGTKADCYAKNSSKRIARSIRHIKRTNQGIK